jgi:hypothetical protein
MKRPALLIQPGSEQPDQEATVNNSTPKFKTCKNADQCVHPHGPVLPEYEFYHYHNGKRLMPMCKECKKEYSKTQALKPKNEAGHGSEQLVINKLRSLGIYAAPGKSSEYKWIDVAAWGCVRIEVKSSRNDKKRGGFLFHMGKKPKKEHERSDIVVLICEDYDITFHVFMSDHPVFYHPDGRSKQGIGYNPRPKRRMPNAGVILDAYLMSKSLNKWHLIEDVRQQIIDEMVFTPYDLDRDRKPQVPDQIDIDRSTGQMRLFE